MTDKLEIESVFCACGAQWHGKYTRSPIIQHHVDRGHRLFWSYVKSAWDIEPREVFEKEARTNGFKSPLAQAAHHTWKRDPKVQPLLAQVASLEGALRNLKADLENALHTSDGKPLANMQGHAALCADCRWRLWMIEWVAGLLARPEGKP